MLNDLEPGDITRADFVRWHEWVDMIDQIKRVGAGEERDPGLITGRFQLVRPTKVDRRTLIDLEDALVPFALMGLLPTQTLEATIADDGFRLEMLELRCIRTSFLCEKYQILRALQVAIVIGCNIGNKIGRIRLPDRAAVNLELGLGCQFKPPDILLRP